MPQLQLWEHNAATGTERLTCGCGCVRPCCTRPLAACPLARSLSGGLTAGRHRGGTQLVTRLLRRPPLLSLRRKRKPPRGLLCGCNRPLPAAALRSTSLGSRTCSPSLTASPFQFALQARAAGRCGALAGSSAYDYDCVSRAAFLRKLKVGSCLCEASTHGSLSTFGGTARAVRAFAVFTSSRVRAVSTRPKRQSHTSGPNSAMLAKGGRPHPALARFGETSACSATAPASTLSRARLAEVNAYRSSKKAARRTPDRSACKAATRPSRCQGASGSPPIGSPEFVERGAGERLADQQRPACQRRGASAPRLPPDRGALLCAGCPAEKQPSFKPSCAWIPKRRFWDSLLAKLPQLPGWLFVLLCATWLCATWPLGSI